MSLAEELLADLEDYGADDDINQMNSDQNEKIDEIDEISEAMDTDGQYDRVTKVARLRDSEVFKRILEKVHIGK